MRIKSSTRWLATSVFLLAACVASAVCYFPSNRTCSPWSTTLYNCPSYPDELDLKKSEITAGPNAEQCALIAYTTSGNTECQSVGSPIDCIFQNILTFCDDEVFVITITNSFQPTRPGGGDSCQL
jgi:hypothetical protein